jgi:PhnB protein
VSAWRIDPFGHRWAIDQHIKDVPHEEVVRLAAAALVGNPG